MRKLILLAALLAPHAHAERAPAPGRLDPRVRSVAYHPDQLVTVNTYFGVSTMIRFADNEAIEDKSVDAGDRKAWALKASARRNILFIRPILEHADTNLTVVTDKRVYLFLLNVLPAAVRQQKDSKAFRSNALTYALTFTYPDDERAKAAAKQAAADKLRAAATLRQRMADARSRASNADYWVAGSEAIGPTDARDDGRFLYLSFAPNQDLPAFYAADDGHETLLNVAVDGTTVTIDRLLRHLVLRRGEQTACLVNRSFHPTAATGSNTIAPTVQRILKDAP